MKKDIMFLEGKRLYFRPVSLSDVPLLVRFAKDPIVRRYLVNVYPISEATEEAWVRKQMERDEHSILFAICLKRGKKLLGMMGLHDIDYISGLAKTGTMLGAKEEWGKGYAQEAKMLLLEYAFHTLNLRKVVSYAFAENKASIAHNKKCGYFLEGIRKKHFFRDGRFHDEVLLAVFREDWEKLTIKKTKR